jgi:hypothetical protein
MQGMEVNYYRGSRSGQEPFIDEIRIFYNDQGEPPEAVRLAIVSAVLGEFGSFNTEGTVTLPFPESQQLAALHQARLDRLEDISASLIESTTNTYRRLEEEFHLRKIANDNDLSTRKADLDTEYSKKLDQLNTAKQELEKEKKDLDDRSNTHARRGLRDKMLENVESRIANFGVSALTSQKRAPVRSSMIVLCAVLLVLTIWTAVELHNQQQVYIEAADTIVKISSPTVQAQGASKLAQPSTLSAISDSSRTLMYLLWARLSLFSLGFVAALIYYIRWENRWAEQHSNAEFQLHQFRLDVNRANWVIESGLEWHKETKGEVPSGILESLTRNLFRAENEPPPALHPADELASALLGSASKLKLKNGDNELEFNKPAKIPKEAP